MTRWTKTIGALALLLGGSVAAADETQYGTRTVTTYEFHHDSSSSYNSFHLQRFSPWETLDQRHEESSSDENGWERRTEETTPVWWPRW